MKVKFSKEVVDKITEEFFEDYNHKYKVYYIKHNDMIVYIGRTDNIKRRTYQHNYHYKKGKENQLYNYLRLNEVEVIELVIIESYKNKADSKRLEMYLILDDYFNGKELQQKVPSISDR